jgi:hypothetical protein
MTIPNSRGSPGANPSYRPQYVAGPLTSQPQSPAANAAFRSYIKVKKEQTTQSDETDRSGPKLLRGRNMVPKIDQFSWNLG